jgi:hypothetical protein
MDRSSQVLRADVFLAKISELICAVDRALRCAMPENGGGAATLNIERRSA